MSGAGTGEQDLDLARRRAWEERTTTPLIVLGVGFLGAYALLVLEERLPGWLHLALQILLLLAWAMFGVDVVVRCALTPRGHRIAFLVHHPLDVLSAVLPVFRALRVVSLVHRVRFFRGHGGDAFRARIVSSMLVYAVVFIIFIALATLNAERDAPRATITSFGDAIWWACVTIATVGYGDMYPVTVPGRIFAVMLMIGGIAIVGTASATIVSLFTERIGQLRERPHEEHERARGTHEPPRDGRAADAGGHPDAVPLQDDLRRE
ncbi:ion channel [Agromyces mediolanus]|uniref:potassium channel family protein n=1 Tax=Agromyces mediolanus TaxID=41986 RepID=UPI00383793E9